LQILKAHAVTKQYAMDNTSTKSLLAFLVILATGVGLIIAATPLLMAYAQNGVPFQKNFGQCKQEKNRNACENNKDSFTGPG
jgi:hypothetical protein